MSSMAPEVGPCTVWITGEDVAACCDIGSTDTALLDEVASEASSILFELSGRQFAGACSQTVRPCNDPCSCWGASDMYGGWSGSYGSWTWAPWGGAWGWVNDCGQLCGCGHLSRAKLPGYPVTSITEVKVNGDVIDPTGYRLDGYKWLTRLWDATDPDNPVPQFWPGCQNLSLDDDQPGTWSVTYEFGVEPPLAAIRAASQLACQLYQACNGQECDLPIGATKITRQGISIDRGLLASFLVPAQTGLVQVDAFVAAYNRTGMRRRPAVFSPDIQQFARKLGS